jgi:4-amino-4-deoxy-L-arabinose transferase-like glycosyltransferase
MSPRSWLSSRRLELTLVLLLLAVGLFVRLRIIYDGNWRFAGADSVGYLKLGQELIHHHRYALSPQHPLAWVRPPLYPIVLALLMPNGVLQGPWPALFTFNFTLDLASGLLVWLMARRLAGPWAGLLGLGATILNPFTPLYAAAMLTETPAAFLSTATLALLVLVGERRPRLGWASAGAGVALSTLLRPDGLLLGAAFLPALIFQAGTRRDRLVRAGLAALAFTVVFAPWPLRNLVATGATHPFGGRIDRFTQPVANYEGYWAWLRSWSTDWTPMTTPTTCFYAPDCPQGLADLRQRGAYQFFDDEAVVQPLIQRRFREGLTPELSHAFADVAAAHVRARPFLVEVELPLSRAWSMWTSANDELLQGRRPWLWHTLWPYMARWSTWQFLLFLIGGAWLSVVRRTRAVASPLYVAVLVRTVILAFTFYCMPRYTLEVLPLIYTLGAAGVVAIAAAMAERWRRRRSAPPA